MSLQNTINLVRSNTMVGEVNKIIFNALVSGKGVYLPEVGSLYIERQAAREISKNKLLSPRNVVRFSSREQLPSLIQMIIDVSSCSEELAVDIYYRWLDKVRESNVINIGGVGTLVDKSFRMDEEFSSTINPQGVRTLIIKHQSHKWVFIFCALCVLIAGGVVAYTLLGDGEKFASKDNPSRENNAPSQTQDIQSDVQPLHDAELVGEDAVNESEIQADDVAVRQEVSPAVSSVGKVSDVVENRFYVVAGVFSTRQNAERAIADILKKYSTLQCDIIVNHKGKFLVTLCNGDTFDECQQFINEHVGLLSNLWVYELQ